MGFINEFKAFAMRGNVVDLAVGVIIGAAFGKIVDAIVGKLFMPIIGYLTSGVDLAKHELTLLKAGEAGAAKDVTLGIGAVIDTTIQFVIVAFALFLVIKAMNRLKAKQPPPPAPAPSAQELYLKEIRDLLAARR